MFKHYMKIVALLFILICTFIITAKATDVRSCSNDYDCGDTGFCDGAICYERHGRNEFCIPSPDGVEDDRCLKGLFCYTNNTCVPSYPSGHACNRTAECGSAMQCLDDKCTPVTGTIIAALALVFGSIALIVIGSIGLCFWRKCCCFSYRKCNVMMTSAPLHASQPAEPYLVSHPGYVQQNWYAPQSNFV